MIPLTLLVRHTFDNGKLWQLAMISIHHLQHLPSSNRWLYVLHRIINGHASSDTASGWIDVHVNRLRAAFRLKLRRVFFVWKRIGDELATQSLTWRNNNWATINELTVSSTPPIRQMIRSFSRREKISYDRSPRPVCSTTIGTKLRFLATVVCKADLLWRRHWKWKIRSEYSTQLLNCIAFTVMPIDVIDFLANILNAIQVLDKKWWNRKYFLLESCQKSCGLTLGYMKKPVKCMCLCMFVHVLRTNFIAKLR